MITTTIPAIVDNGDLMRTIFHAARSNDLAALREHLADPRAVRRRDYRGRTALLVACFAGHEEAIGLLLEAGSDVNQPASDGSFPLYWAALNDDRSIVERLLAAGADVHAIWRGHTALDAAAASNHLAIAERLVAAGARLADPVRDSSALHWAAQEGHHAMMTWLLDQGAPVDALDTSERTSLFHPAGRGDLRGAELLLAAGTNPDHADRFGGTALHLASAWGHEAVVEALLAHGAAVDPINAAGCSPLFYAVNLNQLAVATQLLQHGASPDRVDRIGRDLRRRVMARRALQPFLEQLPPPVR